MDRAAPLINSVMASPLTLGTAGHIDHGKTALIAALTGTDTDRLPEEKRRGISIALGYAALDLPSGRRLSVVDVPGHERFVRTMVAGATGVDLYLMVIAADDGVMPQTREHAAVLAALGVERGVVAVTKADRADPALARAEAAELLPGAEAVAVSARTGAGLDGLRAALDGAAAGLPGRAQAGGPARLHVDRVFTIRGAGTVVTGTLWSGAIGRGDDLVLLPAGRRARVRAVQVHDAPVDRAAAGQRVAVNLVGVEVSDVARGDVLAARDGVLAPSHYIDAALSWTAARPEPGARVQVHHGTREAPARLAALGGRYWQLRLERPLVAAAGDRLVIRRIAPPDTLGGGAVLDPRARRHGPTRDALARLARRERGEPEPGPAPEPTPPPPQPPGPEPLPPAALALERRLREAGHAPPLTAELPPAEAAALPALRAAGGAVRVGRQLHFHPTALAEVERRVVAHCRAHGAITIAELRDDLQTSRKFAQALLEHFDAARLTRRAGDAHVLRRSATLDADER
jgi:selenocysteine-specific elongation factor